MKQREDDLAGKRAFRRMAVFVALLIIGGIVLGLLWVKEPAGTENSPTTGPAPSSSGGTAAGSPK